MTTIATLVDDTAAQLERQVEIAKDRPGLALDPYFYRSHLAYRQELTNLLFKSWIYAAHVSEIPQPGDFVVFEIGEDSIIIVRDGEGQIHALMNICRHRGARVCDKASGNTRTFVCPYHAWTYNLDGSMRSARFMHLKEGFDPKAFGLKKAKLHIFNGLILINCNPDAPDPSAPFSKIARQVGAHGLSQAKVARKTTYKIDANWKLCLENYQECYHCTPAHPMYAKMHMHEDLYENVKDLHEALLARTVEETGVPGIDVSYFAIFSQAEQFGACASADRHALYEGYVTGAEDGKPLAPLMGDFKAFDGGAEDVQLGPVTFLLCYPDHSVLYRFIPRGLTETDVEIIWFVRGDAVEGVDYDVEKLTALWHHTTLEDKYIITQNNAGVNSFFFEPGPIHPQKERHIGYFNEWYLSALVD
ncbi:MAG: aromatic ring-hydroxylating dioxygenase subunit alpha [Pseudomonadota bacterium]